MAMHRHLYHGSPRNLGLPVIGMGNPHNDYGLGFYCTEHPELASEWAVSQRRDGWVNSYALEFAGLKVLNLSQKGYNLLHWLGILLENRTFSLHYRLAQRGRDYILNAFHLDYQSYDVIMGYRADDSYFSFASDFLAGAISYQQLRRAMKLGDLGEQVVLKSQRAFDALHFVGAQQVFRGHWLEKREERDARARARYRSFQQEEADVTEFYIGDILREGMKANDPRL